MLKKFFGWFKKDDKPQEEEKKPLIRVSFSLIEADKVTINVDTSQDDYVEIEKLADLIIYINSVECQLETIEIIGQGLDSKGDPSLFENFIKHFLDVKSKEISSLEAEVESSPCIKPLEML